MAAQCGEIFRNCGWHTCALAMRLVSRGISSGAEPHASLGLSYVRWPDPVRPGDTLTLEVAVCETRLSAAKPWSGIVRWQWRIFNQRHQQLLDLEATSMFKLRDEKMEVPAPLQTGPH